MKLAFDFFTQHKRASTIMSVTFECMLLEIKHSSSAFTKDTISILLIRYVITWSWLYYFIFLKKTIENIKRSYTGWQKRTGMGWSQRWGRKEACEIESEKSCSVVYLDFLKNNLWFLCLPIPCEQISILVCLFSY